MSKVAAIWKRTSTFRKALAGGFTAAVAAIAGSASADKVNWPIVATAALGGFIAVYRVSNAPKQ